MILGTYVFVLTYLLYKHFELFGGLLSIVFVIPLFIASLVYVSYISIQAMYYSFTVSSPDRCLRVLSIITGPYIAISLTALLSGISYLHSDVILMISFFYAAVCFILVFLSVKFGGNNVPQV